MRQSKTSKKTMIEQSPWMVKDEAFDIIRESKLIEILVDDCCKDMGWSLEEAKELREIDDTKFIDVILHRFVELKRVFQTDKDGETYYSFRLN